MEEINGTALAWTDRSACGSRDDPDCWRRPRAPADQAPHQLYKIGDFKLESGEVIKDFPSPTSPTARSTKKSNAILMVTAISGNHHRLDFMIGPGKAPIPTIFIICTTRRQWADHSPSNSTAQPRMQFPKCLIRDMVSLSIA